MAVLGVALLRFINPIDGVTHDAHSLFLLLSFSVYDSPGLIEKANTRDGDAHLSSIEGRGRGLGGEGKRNREGIKNVELVFHP